MGIGRGWGGGQKGLVHNLLVVFFTVGSSKIEVSETYFFDIVITQNDHPSYVKHILACIYIVSPLFRVCVAWGRVGVDSLRGGLAEGNRIFRSFNFTNFGDTARPGFKSQWTPPPPSSTLGVPHRWIQCKGGVNHALPVGFIAGGGCGITTIHHKAPVSDPPSSGGSQKC